VGTDRRSVTPAIHRRGSTSAVGRGEQIKYKIEWEFVLELLFYFVFGLLFRGAGGGEVSGGGTLYMKWRAGRNSASRARMREQVVKHTPTFNFTHLTPLNFLSKTKANTLSFLGTVVGIIGRLFLLFFSSL
jgi:hypothetical protein